MNRVDSGVGRHFAENQGAPDVAEKGDGCAGHDEQQAPPRSHAIKFAEEERDHEGRLKRTHTGAGVVDSDLAGAQLDDIAVLQGERAERI